VLKGLGWTPLERCNVLRQLIDGSAAGRFDIITAAMAITPGRCERVAFSRPDFVARPRSWSRRQPEGCGASPTCCGPACRSRCWTPASRRRRPARGIPGTQIKTYNSRRSSTRRCSRRHTGGRAERHLAAAHDQPPRQLAPRGHPRLPPAGRAVSQPAGAFAFRPADTDLRDAFNAAGMTALQASGTGSGSSRRSGDRGQPAACRSDRGALCQSAERVRLVRRPGGTAVSRRLWLRRITVTIRSMISVSA